MTSQSVYLGRRYVEAELSGEGAHVGVTYKSIDRKGEQSSCCITGNDFSWCMGRNSRGFFAWHAGLETALEGTEIKRIGLYVDFHPGSVSFYDTTGPMRLLHRYQVDFIEPYMLPSGCQRKTMWFLWLTQNEASSHVSLTQTAKCQHGGLVQEQKKYGTINFT